MLSYFSHVQLCVTLGTLAWQASLSMGFSRQEYWNGLLCSPPGDLPSLRIKPMSFMFLASAGRFSTISTTWEALDNPVYTYNLLFNFCIFLLKYFAYTYLFQKVNFHYLIIKWVQGGENEKIKIAVVKIKAIYKT